MNDLDEMMCALAGDFRIYVGDENDVESAKATIQYNTALDKAIEALEELQKLRGQFGDE